jgi:hypothetical protein
VVAGPSGPATPTKPPPLVTKEEKGSFEDETPKAVAEVKVQDFQPRKGEEGKNSLSSAPPSEPGEDGDEEVSWQNAARASLEKTTKPATNNVKSWGPPVAKKTESQREVAKPETKGEARAKPASQNPEPQTSAPPLPVEQFTQEELPPDFWGSELEPPPSSYDDEPLETATSANSNNDQERIRASAKPSVRLPFEMPLFNELQTLFPGRIVRVDAKQQKQAEESEEAEMQTNETTNAAESEDNER